MEKLRILIVEDDPLVAAGLRSQLINLGHTVVGLATRGTEILPLVKKHRPDLAVLDIKLPEMSGLVASPIIMEEEALPIILLTAYSEEGLIEAAEAAGVMSYLVKPVDERDLAPTITLAWQRFRSLQSLRQEVTTLKEALEARKLVDRAKGVLMSRRGLSEEEAFQRIRQQARDRQVKMRDIAVIIIQAEEIMGDQL